MISYTLSMINHPGREYSRLTGSEGEHADGDSFESGSEKRFSKKMKKRHRCQPLFPEIWQEVFKKLAIKELGRVSAVCKAFESLSSNNQSWMHVRGGFLIDPLCHSIKLGMKDRFNFRIETEIYAFCEPTKAESICRFLREIFKNGINDLAVEGPLCQVKQRAKNVFVIDGREAKYKFYIPKHVTFEIRWQGVKFIPLKSPRLYVSYGYEEWQFVDVDPVRHVFKVQSYFRSTNHYCATSHQKEEESIPCESLFHLLPRNRVT